MTVVGDFFGTALGIDATSKLTKLTCSFAKRSRNCEEGG